MQVLVALAAGLVVWIVLWALGAKAFDAFMITAAIVLSAAVARMVEPFVRERLRP